MKVIKLNEGDIQRIVKRVLTEGKDKDAVDQLDNIKLDMEDLLQYYSKNEDGTIVDEKGNKVSSAKNLPLYYKSKLESIIMGSTEDKTYNSQVESLIKEIKNITWSNDKPFFGDYDSIKITYQVTDEYTSMHCKDYKSWDNQQTYSLEDRKSKGLC